MKQTLTLLTTILLTVLCASAQVTDTVRPTPSTCTYGYVVDQSPNNSFPSELLISAGYNSVANVFNQSRTYIYFDLTGNIPTNSTIVSAYLNFHFDSLISPTTYSGSPGQNGTKLTMVTAPWTNTVTWNTQPAIDSTTDVIVGASAGMRTDITNIDVTTPVQFWVNNPDANYGWRFWQINEYTVRQSQEDFASSFDTARPYKMPTIIVTYNYPTGIANVSGSPAISLYPNPTENTLTLQGVTTENFSVNITDMLGRKADFEISGKQINTSLLSAGSYILQFTDLNTNKTVSKQFIKL